MPEVKLPTPRFPLVSGSGIAALGQVYIGEVDQDPTVLANRITVNIIDTDGSVVPIAPASQPFVLSSAGLFEYNGSPVQLRTDQNYSITVQNSAGVQQYYFPDAAITDNVISSVISLAQTTTPASESGVGKVYTKSVGGGTEFFYLDAAGNEVQITSGGALNIDLPNNDVSVRSIFSDYTLGKSITLTSTAGIASLDWSAAQYFYIDLTEDTEFVFSGQPTIGEGIGQTIFLALRDAGVYTVTLSPQAGYTIVIRSTDSPLTASPTGLDVYICTVYSEAELMIVPLYDFV